MRSNGSDHVTGMFRLRKGFGRSVTNEDGIAISDTDRDNVPLGASSKRGIKGG
jgi:hypothetical protein